MRAVAFPSVFVEDLRVAVPLLTPRPPDFDHCWHIAATTSVAKELRYQGVPALQIAHLIYLLVHGVDGGSGAGTVSYPSLDEYRAAADNPNAAARALALDDLEKRIVRWEKQISGREIASSIADVAELRKHLYGDRKTSESVRRALMSSRIDFAAVVRTLTEAGFTPKHLAPTEPIGQAAQRAWQAIEATQPALARTRSLLWIDLEEYRVGSTPAARDLRSALRATFSHVFGAEEGGTILQHGFYFFTPPQWALFNIIESTDGVMQLFIVHDDLQSEVFHTWRRYFTLGNGFGEIEACPGAPHETDTPHATMLLDALAGRRVNADNCNVELQRLRTPVSLVGFMRESAKKESAADPPADPTAEKDVLPIYAPAAPDIDRVVTRFLSTSQFGSTDLSTVPLGIFLVRLHECIYEPAPQQRGIRFDGTAIVDIAASGFLRPLPSDIDDIAAASILQRSLPFFQGCDEASSWINRAQNLKDIIHTQISSWGPRDPAHSDLDRLRFASENYLRLAPWADLSLKEADALVAILTTTRDLVESFIQQETVELDDYARRLRAIAANGILGVPDEYQQDLHDRIDGLRMESIQTYALDLLAIVKLLVAPPLALTPSALDSGRVRQFGAVDRLAYRRRKADLHITNLSDQSFPRRASDLGWPFRLSDINVDHDQRLERSSAILALREEVSAMGDLYLLWVALNGVDASHKVTLSYIEELGREQLNPSPVIALLALPETSSRLAEHRASVRAAAGGCPIREHEFTEESTHRVLPRPQPSQTAADVLSRAVALLPEEVVASALVCPRRLAMQWLAGPSASLGSEHLQSILFGNLPGAMRERHGVRVGEMERLCRELWRHLTDGQRASSHAQRRIKWVDEQRAPQSASYAWLFTTGMSVSIAELGDLTAKVEDLRAHNEVPERNDEKAAVAKWRATRAYSAASGGAVQLEAARSAALAETSTHLPVPEEGPFGVTVRQCRNCPVVDRCSARVTTDP